MDLEPFGVDEIALQAIPNLFGDIRSLVYYYKHTALALTWDGAAVALDLGACGCLAGVRHDYQCVLSG